MRLFGAALLIMGSTVQASSGTIPLPFGTDKEGRDVSVIVTEGRSTMVGLSPALRDARTRMHAKQEVSDDELKELSKRGDGLAAFYYARRLVNRGELEYAASDVAYYSALAVGTGRVSQLPSMIKAMELLDPETEPKERLNKYSEVLYAHAWQGNTLALQAVIDFNSEDALFGPLSEKTRDRIIQEAAKVGDGRIELRMAVEILERPDVSEGDRERARTLLIQAEKSSHLGIATTAKNLLVQIQR